MIPQIKNFLFLILVSSFLPTSLLARNLGIKSLGHSSFLITSSDQSGICMPILKKLSKNIPTLGVCLGHQALAQAFGGKVIVGKELMHGKTSKIFHNQKGLFEDIETPFVATRYHSLIVDSTSVPSCFDITATLEDSTIMAISHKEYKHLHGVQFHPESVLTQFGHKLISNFLKMAEQK